MIRQITTLKPPQPPKVDPKANAEQVTRLQAEATKLQNEIRLANKMGESDAAASARQRLKQVNAELTTVQAAGPAAPQAAPVQPLGVTAPQGNGTTVKPALFTPQTFGGAPVINLAQNKTDDGGVPPEVKTANDILKDIDAGKSVENIAKEKGMSPEAVVAALNAGGMKATTSSNGETRTTVVTDSTGRTITEHQDYHHGNYYTDVEQGGQTTSSPIRDGLGRKETHDYDPKTGAITTRYEDDLGTGETVVRVSQRNGAVTETRTGADGKSETVVTMPDGKKVKLDASQQAPGMPADPSPDGPKLVRPPHLRDFIGPIDPKFLVPASEPGAAGIEKDLADGKSIDDIARDRGLTRDQVLAELAAGGRTVTGTTKPVSDNGDVQSTTVKDATTGKTTTYTYDYQHDEKTVRVVAADGEEVIEFEGRQWQDPPHDDRPQDGRDADRDCRSQNQHDYHHRHRQGGPAHRDGDGEGRQELRPPSG